MPVLQDTPVVIVSINHRPLDNVSAFIRFYLKLELEEIIYTYTHASTTSANANKF